MVYERLIKNLENTLSERSRNQLIGTFFKYAKGNKQKTLYSAVKFTIFVFETTKVYDLLKETGIDAMDAHNFVESLCNVMWANGLSAIDSLFVNLNFSEGAVKITSGKNKISPIAITLRENDRFAEKLSKILDEIEQLQVTLILEAAKAKIEGDEKHKNKIQDTNREISAQINEYNGTLKDAVAGYA